MTGYSVYLPHYSVGEDCYEKIPSIVGQYGTKAVVIGGRTAMAKAREALLAGVRGSPVRILDFVWYGGNSTMENVQKLIDNPLVRQADMLFAVGGGRACDTVKTLADRLDMPLFTFPTLASNCASCTAICVIYNPDGSFKEYYYPKQPPLHTFIHTRIVAESPYDMFWAGVGDALSKEYEVAFACEGRTLDHLPQLGLGIAKTCTEPLLTLGEKALADCRRNRPSWELEQVALAIIMLTGIVSNCEVHTNVPDPRDAYYYNSSLAHCVYYGASQIPACETHHLHGEIVAFGVLCLLTYAGKRQERDKILAFNRRIGLPVTLGEIDLTTDDLPVIAQKASTVIEWRYVPGEPTEEKFIRAIRQTDEAGQQALAGEAL